jgi:hemolysin D
MSAQGQLYSDVGRSAAAAQQAQVFSVLTLPFRYHGFAISRDVLARERADSQRVDADDIVRRAHRQGPKARRLVSAYDRDPFARELLQAHLNLAKLRGLANQFSQPASQQPALVDPPSETSAADLALAQTAMIAQQEQQGAKLADIDQQIAAKQAEASQAQATIEKLQASLPMVEGQEQIRRELKDSEVGNKLAWYEANQQLIEQTHELSVEAQAKQAALPASQALRQQRSATVAEYQVNTLQDLDKVKAQMSELQAELAKAEVRVRQSTLTAPIDGTVQQIAVHTIGGVVTPAEPLLSVVPDQPNLIVEAMVQNKDVGFVHAGQAVRVKVETFNFTRYGLIDGTVLDVTRDAVQNNEAKKNSKSSTVGDNDSVGDEQANAPVYVAHIVLNSGTIITESGPTKLGAGMQVQAEIQTGRRRMIGYLLSPLVRHLDESMRER